MRQRASQSIEARAAGAGPERKVAMLALRPAGRPAFPRYTAFIAFTLLPPLPPPSDAINSMINGARSGGRAGVLVAEILRYTGCVAQDGVWLAGWLAIKQGRRGAAAAAEMDNLI